MDNTQFRGKIFLVDQPHAGRRAIAYRYLFGLTQK